MRAVRSISIVSIAGLCLCLLVCPAAWAQQQPQKSSDEKTGKKAAEAEQAEEIIITAKPLDEQGVSVDQISRETIVSRGATVTTDILQSEPSINVATGKRGENIFSLRGFDQRQIVTLVDGVPTYIPYDGQVDLGMLPAELVDHVTVVKGPGSILFGPSGLGGAVNVVTRHPDECPFLQAIVEGGGPSSIDARATHANQLGKIGYLLNAGYFKRDYTPLSTYFEPTINQPAGRRLNSDRRLFHVLGRLSWDATGNHGFGATISYLDGAKGVPPSILKFTPVYWRFNVWQNLRASVRHRGDWGENFMTDEVVYYQTFDNLLDGYDDASYTTQDTSKAFHDWYHDRIYGGRLSAVYQADFAWGGVLGRLWSDVQVDQHKKQSDYVDAGEDYLRTLLTVAPEIEVDFDELTANASLQNVWEFASNLPEGGGTRIEADPLVSLGYDPRGSWSMRATVARRSRIPTLRERFTRAFGFLEPNPDLGPEHAWHFGLEGSWRPRRGLNLKAGAYDAEVQDLIDIVPIGNGVQQYQNHEQARLAGFELEAAWRPFDWLRLELGYVYSYAILPDQKPPDDHLQYRPAHKAMLALSWTPNDRWQATLTGRLTGSQKFLNPDNRAWSELGTYLALDAKLYVRIGKMVGLWVRGTNLLDSNYQTVYGYPVPGREVWLGVSMTYDKDSGR